MPTESGYYILDTDVTLNDTWTASDRSDITFSLNGHKIKAAEPLATCGIPPMYYNQDKTSLTFYDFVNGKIDADANLKEMILNHNIMMALTGSNPPEVPGFYKIDDFFRMEGVDE